MNQQVSRLQFMFLMLWTIMGTGILTMPFGIAHFTIHDGWLVPIMFLAGSAISILVCAAFMHTFPSCTLTEGFERAFGPWIGRMFGVWVTVMMYIGLCMLLRELSLFLEINALPRTPLFVSTAVIVAPLGLAGLLGIASMARLSEFLTPLAILLGLTISVLAFWKADLAELHPMLEYGWRPIYRGGLLPATGFAFQFVLGLQFSKATRHPEKLLLDLVIVASACAGLGVLIMIVIIGVLGNASGYLNYPVLEVVRSIRIGEFLERFDTIYAMGVITTIVMKMGVWQFAWLTAIQDIARLSNYRGLVLAATTCVWAGSVFLFHDASELGEFMLYVTPSYFGLSLIVLPLAAVATAKIRQWVTGRILPLQSP